MRHWLRIPPFKRRQAILAGCQFDQQRQQWYVEEPLKPGLLLSDFAEWLTGSDSLLEARQRLARNKKAQGGSSLR